VPSDFGCGVGKTEQCTLEYRKCRWTPDDPSFEAAEGFTAPQETRNLPPQHFRQIIPLAHLMPPPTPDELREWTNPTADEQRRWDSEEAAPCDQFVPGVTPSQPMDKGSQPADKATRGAVLVRRGRRCVWRAGLNPAEVNPGEYSW